MVANRTDLWRRAEDEWLPWPPRYTPPAPLNCPARCDDTVHGGFCSAHGACDTSTGACACDDGWSGVECLEPPPPLVPCDFAFEVGFPS